MVERHKGTLKSMLRNLFGKIDSQWEKFFLHMHVSSLQRNTHGINVVIIRISCHCGRQVWVPSDCFQKCIKQINEYESV